MILSGFFKLYRKCLNFEPSFFFSLFLFSFFKLLRVCSLSVVEVFNTDGYVLIKRYTFRTSLPVEVIRAFLDRLAEISFLTLSDIRSELTRCALEVSCMLKGLVAKTAREGSVCDVYSMRFSACASVYL